MTKRKQGGRRQRARVESMRSSIIFFIFSAPESATRSIKKQKNVCWWELKKAKKLRGKEEEPLLTLCSSFLVNAGGVGLALLCVCSSSSSITQCRVHSTEVAGLTQQTPLKCYTSVERGSKRELRLSGPLISLLWPAPTLFLLFPPQIVIPYLGDGREGKNKTCDFRVWCGHWKEFSEFQPLPLKNKTGLGGLKGGRDDQILEWSLTEHGKGSSSN